MGEENEVAVKKKDETSAKKLVFCKLCRNHKRESIVKLHKEVCEYKDCECKPCIITKKDRLRARDSTRRRRSINNEAVRREMEKEKANSKPATTPIKPIEPKERLATAKTKKIRKDLTTSKSLPPVPLPKICADQPQRMDVTLETTVVSDPNPIEDTYKKQYGVYPDFMSRGMDDVRPEDFSKYINVSPLWMPTPQVYNYFHPAAPSDLRARMCEQDVIGCPWAMYYPQPTSRIPAHAYYNPHSAFIPFMGRFQFAKSTPPPLGHRSAHLPHLL